MKPFKIVTDPEAFQLLTDETRRKILYLLRAKEMSVAQIAESLDLTPQAIYRHIRKMKDKDLIEIAREERTGHLIETYYRASAEVFYMSHGEAASPAHLEQQTAEAFKALPRLGFDVEADPPRISKLVDLQRRLDAIGQKRKWAENLDGLDDVDFLTKQNVADLAVLLAMTDEEYAEWWRLHREFRKVLRSTLGKSGKAPTRAA